jgi:hypothetical protein
MSPHADGGSERRNAGLETVGIVIRRPSDAELDAALRGMLATVVVGLRCGECDGEWDDALAAVGHRTSICPHCGATNRVFSKWTT